MTPIQRAYGIAAVGLLAIGSFASLRNSGETKPVTDDQIIQETAAKGLCPQLNDDAAARCKATPQGSNTTGVPKLDASLPVVPN